VAQNLEKLLQYLVRHSGRPGALVPIEQSQDYTIIDVQGESELQYYLRCLAEMDLIKAYIPNPKYELTYRGWDRALGASAGAAAHGRVFVAMWFDPEMGAAYKEGIEPALVETGYKPICLSNVLLNDDINFRILMEIRLAQFTVADITGARGGVYFEAGFAKGLGREVFFTCREDRFSEDKHFDTEHLQHTTWKNAADLRFKLREKILALMGPGPHPIVAPGP
jgi:hypothetical protein